MEFIKALGVLFQQFGATGFVIIVLAAVSFTLLTVQVATFKWVLENMVPLAVHKGLQEEVCDSLGFIKEDTAVTRSILVSNGGRTK